MTRTLQLVAWALAPIVLTVAFEQFTVRAYQTDGWQIPPNAEAESNPVPATPEAVARGKALYGDKCRRCHGPGGRGDGVDADPDHKPGDLTDSSRAPRNPDGVMFYKIWNGRKKPKMPAFSAELSREQVWTLIQYVKTLRK